MVKKATFFEELRKSGVNVNSDKSYWLDQLIKYNDRQRGVDMDSLTMEIMGRIARY